MIMRNAEWKNNFIILLYKNLLWIALNQNLGHFQDN